jgi:hypothetical protein
MTKQTNSKCEEVGIETVVSTFGLGREKSREIKQTILNLISTTTKQAVEANDKKWRERIEGMKKEEETDKNIAWEKLDEVQKASRAKVVGQNEVISDLLKEEGE